jgi:hypothetical protein
MLTSASDRALQFSPWSLSSCRTVRVFPFTVVVASATVLVLQPLPEELVLLLLLLLALAELDTDTSSAFAVCMPICSVPVVIRNVIPTAASAAIDHGPNA